MMTRRPLLAVLLTATAATARRAFIAAQAPAPFSGSKAGEVTLSRGFWMAKYDHIGFRAVAVQR